jgi:two-component SAPR family response regulator
MKICFYGSETDHQHFLALIKSIPKYADWMGSCQCCTDYDSFVDALRCTRYDAVFVTENNANGMEGVIAVRNLCPGLPVIWFSNDEGFGCQAYRLNTDFFHSKPLTPQILEIALDRLPSKRKCSIS